MRISIKEIRELVREAQGALKLLDVLEMRLILAKEQKIEEIITAIRIIKGVATVTQVAPIKRTPNGSRILEILVTFDSQDLEPMEYIDALSRLTKRIPDVKTVVVKTLNDQPVRDATGKRKLVY